MKSLKHKSASLCPVQTILAVYVVTAVINSGATVGAAAARAAAVHAEPKGPKLLLFLS